MYASNSERKCHSYTQIYNNGVVESIIGDIFKYIGDEKLVDGSSLEELIIEKSERKSGYEKINPKAINEIKISFISILLNKFFIKNHSKSIKVQIYSFF